MGNRGSKESRKVQNITEKGQVPIMKTGISFENQNPRNEPTQKQDHISNRRSYYIPSRNRVEKLLYFPTHPKVTDTHKTLHNPSKNKKKSHKKSPSTSDNLIPSSVSSVKTCQEQGSSVLSSEPTHETPLRHLNGVLTDQLNTTDYILSIPPPPIVTKPIKKDINKPNLALRNQSSKQGGLSSHGNMRRPSTPQTRRIKIRLNSPKLAKKILREKKGLADSFVVVKLSSDPQRDFRESMLEMILQKNLWDSKDLEELLSCYLYLNSDEYQHLIVKAFKQIWFDLTVLNLKYK